MRFISLQIATVLVVYRLAVKAFILGVAGSSLREADFSVHFIVFVNSLYRIIIIKTISWLLFQIWKKSVLDPVTQLTRNNFCGNRNCNDRPNL